MQCYVCMCSCCESVVFLFVRRAFFCVCWSVRLAFIAPLPRSDKYVTAVQLVNDITLATASADGKVTASIPPV